MLLDTDSEALFLFGQWSPREGLGLALRDHVFPNNGNATKDVNQEIDVGKAEGDGRGVDGTGEAEVVAGEGGSSGGAKVELGNIVELVYVNTIDLNDVVVAVSISLIEEALETLD